MMMPSSSEFLALCRAQIGILVQALGASIAVVYLTLVEGAQAPLVPIAIYPEGGMGNWSPGSALAATVLPPDAIAALPAPSSSITPAALSPSPPPRLPGANRSFSNASTGEPEAPSKGLSQGKPLAEQRQIMLPLVHEEIVMGVLVARRDDRLWQSWEKEQIEEIAKTLALACVLDQRYQWLAQERHQDRLIQRQQRDLMDSLLHQFRNSLTALQTFGKLIVKRLQPDTPNREVAENLTRETERLRELSQQLEFVLKAGQSPSLLPLPTVTAAPADLGDAALEVPSPRVPNGGFLPGIQFSLQPCLIEEILHPLLASTQIIAQEKGLALHTEVPDDLPPVLANPQALRELLNNLLENAVKYTPENGCILARAVELDSLLAIAVTDTGPGIPAQDLPHIFERNFRGVQAQGTLPGSGLGLAIAQTLITQMHGTLEVFSPALPEYLNIPGYTRSPKDGPGTTFVVKLPVALAGEEDRSG
jgi:signal transduction histidine kinase